MEDDKGPTESMAVPAMPDDGPLVDRYVAIGVDVGGYLIDGELGRGGMGVVYRATHPLIGKRAAIKVLKPSLSNNPATVERFIQEARSVNQIGHPNIVDIFAFGRLPDGRSYLVMDLLEGEPLRKRVKRGPLHVSEATAVIDEIASALIAAHDKGFVHRDLKPDNVFLVEHPARLDLKLLDFGLAKLLPNATNTRAYRTATGAQLGTPDYMSPEQLRGTDVDHRTDLYALGIMAFEILTGKRPRRYANGTFDLGGKTISEILAAVPFVPIDLAQLVETMVAPEPDDRPSLMAVRAVIKRMRPSLPVIAVVDVEPELPADEPMDLTASSVGARPIVPTPAAGMPTINEQAPAPPVNGLRTSSKLPSTTIGVPPPPAQVMRPQVGPSQTQLRPPGESRLWLAIGLVLAVAAAIALVVVMTS